MMEDCRARIATACGRRSLPTEAPIAGSSLFPGDRSFYAKKFISVLDMGTVFSHYVHCSCETKEHHLFLAVSRDSSESMIL